MKCAAFTNTYKKSIIHVSKSFTHYGWRVLLLVLFCPGIRAQVWTPVTVDSTISVYYPFFRQGMQLIPDQSGNIYTTFVDIAPNQPPYNPYMNRLSCHKLTGEHWTGVGPDSITNVNPGCVNTAIDRKGIPYIAANYDSSFPFQGPGSVPLPVVYTLRDSAWVQLGRPDSPAKLSSYPPSIAITHLGKLFYAFMDSVTHNPKVYTYTGVSWKETGAGTLGNGKGGKAIQIVIDHTGTPYLMFEEKTDSSGRAPTLVVARYDGLHWVKVGNKPLLSTSSNQAMAFDQTNTLNLLCSTDSFVNNIKLVKLTGNTWTSVGGPISPFDGSAANPLLDQYSSTYTVPLILAIGPSNTPYVAYSLDLWYWGTSSPSPIVVKKFNGSAWVDAGSNLIVDDGYSSFLVALAVDSKGTPYCAYDESDFTFASNVFVKKLDENLKQPQITFHEINTTYGSPDFSPGATSTDTFSPIQYTIGDYPGDTTVATMVNGKIHIRGFGTVDITASQKVDSPWYPPTPVTVFLFVQKDSQVICFPPIPEKEVGDSDFKVWAKASSGLPVTFRGSDSTIASVKPDGSVHILQQGSIIVTAHQAGGRNYFPAADVTQELTIEREGCNDHSELKAWCSSPTTIQVNITTQTSQAARIEIFSFAGRRVYDREVYLSATGANQFQATIDGSQPGIYYVRVTGQIIRLMQKLMVMGK